MLKWIVAMDKNGIIGKNWWMPWHEPEDLKRFKEMTQWQICLMWRKTYEWLKKYRPNSEWYPHASKNLVFSRNMDEKPWVEIIHNVDELKKRYWNEIVWVLWWAKTFEILAPYIDEIYITLIPWEHDWDTYMPNLPPGYIENIWEAKSWIKFQKYSRIKDPESLSIINQSKRLKKY